MGRYWPPKILYNLLPKCNNSSTTMPQDKHSLYRQQITPKVEAFLSSTFKSLEKPLPVVLQPPKPLQLGYALAGAATIMSEHPKRGGRYVSQVVPDRQMFNEPLTAFQLRHISLVGNNFGKKGRRLSFHDVPVWYHSCPSPLALGHDYDDDDNNNDASNFLTSLLPQSIEQGLVTTGLDAITVTRYLTLIHWWTSTFRKQPGPKRTSRPACCIIPIVVLSTSGNSHRSGDVNDMELDGGEQGTPGISGLVGWDVLKKEKNDPFEYSFILIPVHLDRNEWVTVAVDVAERSIVTYYSDYTSSSSPGAKGHGWLVGEVKKWLDDMETQRHAADKSPESGMLAAEPWGSQEQPPGWPHTVGWPEKVEPEESGVLMLQTMMTISRLQNPKAVYSGNFGNNETLIQTRQKMAIELIQQKLLFRTIRDNRPIWPNGQGKIYPWVKTSMRLGFFDAT